MVRGRDSAQLIALVHFQKQGQIPLDPVLCRLLRRPARRRERGAQGGEFALTVARQTVLLGDLSLIIETIFEGIAGELYCKHFGGSAVRGAAIIEAYKRT